MQEIAIRRATVADLDALLRFQQGVLAAERPFDPTIADGPVQYYDIQALLASDQVLFVIAEGSAGAVGCGFTRIEPAKRYLKHATHAYLGLMYVDPACRGQSVIGKIIDALKQWARSRGVTELRLEVYAGNTAAIRAYGKAGFEPLMVEMRSSA
ncbi:MAG: GNAT family N-acetyltransferase [Steroidobacterales bacterium]